MEHINNEVSASAAASILDQLPLLLIKDRSFSHLLAESLIDLAQALSPDRSWCDGSSLVLVLGFYLA